MTLRKSDIEYLVKLLNDRKVELAKWSSLTLTSIGEKNAYALETVKINDVLEALQ